MHAIVHDFTTYLSHLSYGDIITAAGTISTVVTYGVTRLLNLSQRRFIKAFLGYLVAPGIVTVVLALVSTKPHILAQYPWIVVIGQLAYYAIERIIASVQTSNDSPTVPSSSSPATGF